VIDWFDEDFLINKDMINKYWIYKEKNLKKIKRDSKKNRMIKLKELCEIFAKPPKKNYKKKSWLWI